MNPEESTWRKRQSDALAVRSAMDAAFFNSPDGYVNGSVIVPLREKLVSLVEFSTDETLGARPLGMAGEVCSFKTVGISLFPSVVEDSHRIRVEYDHEGIVISVSLVGLNKWSDVLSAIELDVVSARALAGLLTIAADDSIRLQNANKESTVKA